MARIPTRTIARVLTCVATVALPAALLGSGCSSQRRPNAPGSSASDAPLSRAAGAAGVSAQSAATGGAANQPLHYYLALGDSLAQGMQPDGAGIDHDTDEGYVDQLYAMERREAPDLRLLKLGCGGETTTSFLSGRGNPAALLLGCNPAGGSQMAAAESFLRAHRKPGEVALVTLDIGANDVGGCVGSGRINTSCFSRALDRIRANLPIILHRLRAAAAPGTPMAGMTLYDSFLGEALSASPRGRSGALETASAARDLNDTLVGLLRAGGFRVARVERAFHSDQLSRTEALPGTSQRAPVAVVEICRLTWMCAQAPVGPDPHANRLGYGVIAAAFATALRSGP